MDIVLVLTKTILVLIKNSCANLDSFFSTLNLFHMIILHARIRIISQLDFIRPRDPHFHNTTLIPTNNILNRIRITRRHPPDGCSISRVMLQVSPSLRSGSRVETRRSNLSLDRGPRPHYCCVQNGE